MYHRRLCFLLYNQNRKCFILEIYVYMEGLHNYVTVIITCIVIIYRFLMAKNIYTMLFYMILFKFTTYYLGFSNMFVAQG